MSPTFGDDERTEGALRNSAGADGEFAPFAPNGEAPLPFAPASDFPHRRSLDDEGRTQGSLLSDRGSGDDFHPAPVTPTLLAGMASHSLLVACCRYGLLPCRLVDG
jgi:hypothetical protein